jgi:hypothetical protein
MSINGRICMKGKRQKLGKVQIGRCDKRPKGLKAAKDKRERERAEKADLHKISYS